MKRVLLLLLLPVLGGAYWVWQKRSDAPVVPTAKVTRETIVNTLSTNGKVEPIEYQDIRVETSGLLTRLLLKQGDSVKQGQTIAQISETGLKEELQAAEAREAQAQSDLRGLQQGGRSSDMAELDGQLVKLRSDRGVAQQNYESLQRLVLKDAATRVEAEQARQRMQTLDLEIGSIERKRGALVGRNEVTSSQARVREAAANVQLAKTRIRLDWVVSPISGVAYSVPAHSGAFVNIGDAIASVGKLNPVRVKVFVDEPEMGRVSEQEPVRITWDAMTGKHWEGMVERRPSEVVALGTRQVGEVLCTIANPTGELVPGTNVNAFIQTGVSTNALTIPKAALRNDDGVGVYVVGEKNTLRWQKVKTGISSAIAVEIVEGLKDGDAVVLQTDQPLKSGLRISKLNTGQ